MKIFCIVIISIVLDHSTIVPTDLTCFEEASYLSCSILCRVRGMYEIVSDGECEVGTDRAHICLCWICRTTELSHTTDSIIPFDDQKYYRTHSHVSDDLRVKWFACEMSIVFSELGFWDFRHLHSDDLESSLFDTREYRSDKSAMYRIWFEYDKWALCHRKIDERIIVEKVYGKTRKSKLILRGNISREPYARGCHSLLARNSEPEGEHLRQVRSRRHEEVDAWVWLFFSSFRLYPSSG